MIDPSILLAYSVHTNPGVYALLIGSGVSRTASIPTGWDIVLDLVSKLAHLQNETCEPDPAAWYHQKYGEEPDYSKLLDSLARSPEERQQLLAAYFEPTDIEREEGLKSPTLAHRSIVKLVASRHVRVILTTNFDRLLERAIEDEGMTPVVLTTPDAIQGAMPLVHQRCCIVKLHGDYLDTRIKNTLRELDEYDSRVNEILDRVLDEFGLIVCGWSGQWDSALRSAFERCASRRFTTYWATKSDLRPQAKRLLELRCGVAVAIRDADSFFYDLAEKVTALDDLRQPHPLSIAAAAAITKRLLSDDKAIIRLHDLVTQETEKSFQTLQPVFRTFRESSDQNEKVAKALSEFCACLENLRTVCVHASYWSTPQQFRPFIQIPARLATDPSAAAASGSYLHEPLRFIPSVITLYTMGLAALAGGKFVTLTSILAKPALMILGTRRPYLTGFNWHEVQEWFKLLPFHKGHYPASEWLFSNCRIILREVLPDDNEYERLFDQFEIIRSLVYIDLKQNGAYDDEQTFRAPGGRFVWKLVVREQDLLAEIESDDAVRSGLCNAGLFGKRPDWFSLAIHGFRPAVQEMAQRCW